MKLLIVTQAVAQEDPVLGFFHRWIEEFSKQFDQIEVVCLFEGSHAFPQNVRVHSLGKERERRHGLIYAFRFLQLAWKLRRDYEAVFVHMNQEYLLAGGPLWRFLGKRVYLWRNHYAGSIFTDLAAAYCEKVFCTSRHSYTAKYKKTVLMPVGVDTTRFSVHTTSARIPRSILFFSRVTESKRPGLIVEALIVLHKRGVDFTASFVGTPPSSRDEIYLAALRQRVADANLMDHITFKPGVRNAEAPEVFKAHQIFVNASPSGMFDKVIFEAAASGCTVLAASDDYRHLAGEDYWFKDAPMLADRLQMFLSQGAGLVPAFVEEHSLASLMDALKRQITG